MLEAVQFVLTVVNEAVCGYDEGRERKSTVHILTPRLLWASSKHSSMYYSRSHCDIQFSSHVRRDSVVCDISRSCRVAVTNEDPLGVPIHGITRPPTPCGHCTDSEQQHCLLWHNNIHCAVQ